MGPILSYVWEFVRWLSHGQRQWRASLQTNEHGAWPIVAKNCRSALSGLESMATGHDQSCPNIPDQPWCIDEAAFLLMKEWLDDDWSALDLKTFVRWVTSSPGLLYLYLCILRICMMAAMTTHSNVVTFAGHETQCHTTYELLLWSPPFSIAEAPWKSNRFQFWDLMNASLRPVS